MTRIENIHGDHVATVGLARGRTGEIVLILPHPDAPNGLIAYYLDGLRACQLGDALIKHGEPMLLDDQDQDRPSNGGQP